MQQTNKLFNHRKRLGAVGLLAIAALPVAANLAHGADGSYTWSAELLAVDAGARTITVQAPLVSDAEVDLAILDAGDRVTLTWSGINTAAGIRRITTGSAPAGDELTLPIEFVSSQIDNRYARFKVRVPEGDIAKLAALSSGQYVTAESPRRATRFEEAVAAVRPYTDVR